MNKLNELYLSYQSSIQFIFVYILEAHAQDEWPIRSSRFTPNGEVVLYNQPRTIEERISVARDFYRDFQLQMSVLVDKPPENRFEKLYAPWPLRIYFVDKDRKLIYKAQPSETMLELNEIQRILESFSC